MGDVNFVRSYPPCGRRDLYSATARGSSRLCALAPIGWFIIASV